MGPQPLQPVGEAPAATPTRRTARTPVPGDHPTTTAEPPEPAADGTHPETGPVDSARGSDSPGEPVATPSAPGPAPQPTVTTTSSRPEPPPGDFWITSGTDVSGCYAGSTFPVRWTTSAGAIRYVVYASNQGSQSVSGTAADLPCPTQAGAFTVTVIAYNERVQGTNAPTLTYVQPQPLDDQTPSASPTQAMDPQARAATSPAPARTASR